MNQPKTLVARSLLCALTLAAALGCQDRTVPATPAAPPTAAPLFVFGSSAPLNLHERVLLAATARFPPPAGSARDFPPAALDAAWDTAVRGYARAFGSMFSPAATAAQRGLSRADAARFCAPDPTPVVPHAVCALWPAYQRDQWAKDDAKNKAFIDRLQKTRPELWQAIADDLVRLYGMPWPKHPLRVEVAAEVGGPGAAYTTDAGYVTLASTDARHQGDAGLEILFHEASHLMFAEVEKALAAAGEKTGRPVPDALWHALLFYGTGRVVQKHIGPGYTTYAEAQGLYTRGGFDGFAPALDAHWRPYLDGEVTLDTALAGVLTALPPDDRGVDP